MEELRNVFVDWDVDVFGLMIAVSRVSRRKAMIIVSGRIYVRSGARQAFLTSSREAVAQARGALGCRDFVVPGLSTICRPALCVPTCPGTWCRPPVLRSEGRETVDRPRASTRGAELQRTADRLRVG
jgi:hypothetical protein